MDLDLEPNEASDSAKIEEPIEYITPSTSQKTQLSSALNISHYITYGDIDNKTKFCISMSNKSPWVSNFHQRSTSIKENVNE